MRTTVADPDEDIFDALAARISYLSGDYADPETFQRLASAIGAARQPVFYLEVPPSLFATVVRGLGEAGSEHQCPGGDREALRSRPRFGDGA